MNVEYRLTTLFPANRLKLAVQHGTEAFPAKAFVMTVEAATPLGERVSPKELNWFYSSYLAAPFLYMPESGLGLVSIPSPLKSSVPFSEVRIRIAAWGAGAKNRDASFTFGSLVYSYALSPAPKRRNLSHSEIGGVLTPIEVVA